MNKKNLHDLLNVAELKKEIVKLQRENKAAFTTIDKLMRQLDQKDQSISSLENYNSKGSELIKINLNSEESIAEIELSRLEAISKDRALTLEETKKYDIFVKSKRSREGKKSVIDVNARDLELKTDDLLKIVGTSNNDE